MSILCAEKHTPDQNIGCFWHRLNTSWASSLFLLSTKTTTVLIVISGTKLWLVFSLCTYMKPRSLCSLNCRSHTCCEKFHQTAYWGCHHSLFSPPLQFHCMPRLRYLPVLRMATLDSSTGGLLTNNTAVNTAVHIFWCTDTFLLGAVFAFYHHCDKLPQSSHLKQHTFVISQLCRSEVCKGSQQALPYLFRLLARFSFLLL